MRSTTSHASPVARRYAAAFLDLAAQANAVDKINSDMENIGVMMASSTDLRTLVDSPRLSRAAQGQALQALAAKAGFQQLTRNFLGVLAANRRVAELPGVLAAFRDELRRRRGEVVADVRSAFALTPAQTKNLQEQLSKSLGGAQVTLNVGVQKDLLGGMVVTVGSRMIDDSVKGKLERLRRAMNSNSNDVQQKEVG